jgi:hypothetical protein
VQQVDDAGAGFVVAFDVATNTLQVRAWGFWNARVARAFGPTVIGECKANPGIGSLVIDMKELKPMRDEGQYSFGELIGALGQLGVPKVRLETASQLTKLQLMRIVSERDSERRVEFI